MFRKLMISKTLYTVYGRMPDERSCGNKKKDVIDLTNAHVRMSIAVKS